MRKPFSRSAVHIFADRADALALAREAAANLAARCPEVTRVLLFGSYARNDYTLKSDLDLLVVLSSCDRGQPARLTGFLPDLPVYPIDVFPYTEAELDAAARTGDPFVKRALSEGIEVFRREVAA
jgi:predicted nucleotidyltransferase